MKKLKISILLACLLQVSQLFSQITTIEKDNEKAIVYMVIPRMKAFGLKGEKMNFTHDYFLDSTYLGKSVSGKILKFELEAGKYLFWTVLPRAKRGGALDQLIFNAPDKILFIDAKIEKGKTYYILTRYKIGTFKFMAVNNGNTKYHHELKEEMQNCELAEFDSIDLDIRHQEYISDLITESLKNYKGKWSSEKKYRAKVHIDHLFESVNLDDISLSKKKKKKKKTN